MRLEEFSVGSSEQVGRYKIIVSGHGKSFASNTFELRVLWALLFGTVSHNQVAAQFYRHGTSQPKQPSNSGKIGESVFSNTISIIYLSTFISSDVRKIEG